MASSEAEDLNRAIALSLGQPDPRQTSAKEVINLDSDEDLEAERGGQQPALRPGIAGTSDIPRARIPTERTASDSNVLGMLGLNRAQMEADRLSRKRKATSPPIQVRQKRALISPSRPKSPDPLPYPHGIAKKTWVKGQNRQGDDVTLHEVLQPDILQLAVLSSFQWDIPWLFTHVKNTTKTTLVMQAKEVATRKQFLRETEGQANLRLCFPGMEGQINCMHSKLMLLSYPESLRIVVPTANLVPYDWGETGTMENMVWMIDLPRLEDEKRVEKIGLTPFGRELVQFLEEQEINQNIVDSICGFDFFETKEVAFVHTIGGAHIGEAWKHTGYPGLSTAVNQLGLASAQRLHIDFVTSSVGALNPDFVANIYRACSGADFSSDIDRPKKPNTSSDLAILAEKETIATAINANFRFYFPTHETVKASRAGYAGTICMQSKYYESPKFPRQLIRDCKSVRKGVLMHNKILYVRPEHGGQAWAYVGSANCSESAWGNRIVKDKMTKGPKLNCRNWECGVVVKCPKATGEGMEVFKGTIPVPMEWPGEVYGGRTPWYFME